ncbi:lactation elevated protein 1 isoform X3 [Ananas comosus]|uniref:Lactation elevated protein 1 isoform X3 n=1 Tax=Ananas comosus TaxID=4615 RepID=A0A6P5FSP7_ANACO|nr:lactation elevated protein 1 isoform X3 [Ananas comosus]
MRASSVLSQMALCRRSLVGRGSLSLRPTTGGAPCRYCHQSRSFSDRRSGPLAIYRRMVSEGKLQQDMYQEKVASELEDLLGRLEQYEKEMEGYHEKLVIWEKNRESERRKLLLEEAEIKQQDGVWIENKKRSGFLNKLISRRRSADVEPGVGKMVSYLNREKKLDTVVGQRPVAPLAPKGIYLYGNVGSGKTMLMDMFYGATEGIVKHRRRFHFHEAMLEIHEHMHDIWKNQAEEKSLQSSAFSWIAGLSFDTKVKEWLVGEEKYKKEVQTKHILPAVADKFLIDRRADKSGASILCFDEIQTVDVFAIVALSGIMSRLLSTGTVLVATSNRAPEDLNQDGMQRDIFLEFLSTLEENCQKFFVGSKTDYRRLIPTNNVDQVGAADYIAIARNYHTVFISEIPVMSMKIRDKARRFITLIDELYNHHCCLICLASTSIDNLFQGTEEGTLFDLESFQFETEIEGSKLRRDVLASGSISTGPTLSGIASLLSGQEELFAFRRAVSRLIEMQTSLYLQGVQVFHPFYQQSRALRSSHSVILQSPPSS